GRCACAMTRIVAGFLLQSGIHHDRSLVLHGQQFHFLDWGAPTAPVVVLLHGVTGHARAWDDEARALAARYRVLALDARGHGDSDPAPDGDYTVTTMAGDLTALIDAVELRRFSLVGLSMGGRVAIAFAGAHPRRVDSLVVVDIGPDIAPAGRLRVGTLMAHTPERFDDFAAAVAWARATNPRYTEAMLRHRVTHGTRPANGGLVWKYDRAIRDAVRSGQWRDPVDLWPLWSAITCPTLIVRGAESDVLAPETAKRMLATNPHARLVEVPEAGHTVPGEQPAAFQRLLTAFLGASPRRCACCGSAPSPVPHPGDPRARFGRLQQSHGAVYIASLVLRAILGLAWGVPRLIWRARWRQPGTGASRQERRGRQRERPGSGPRRGPVAGLLSP